MWIEKIEISRLLVVTMFLGLPVFLNGCSKNEPQATNEASAPTAESAPVKAVSDEPIAEFQSRLLDMAFEAASQIPAEPFIKDQCRVQQQVADVCLELHQPLRAVKYADQINNWRRGLLYANAAYYLARQDYPAERIRQGLELAEKIAAIDHGQKWRSDRIKTRIAQTNVLLDNRQQARTISRDLQEGDSQQVMETTAMTGDEDTFDELVKKLDDAIALENMEITQSALYAYANLYDRYYDNPQRRDLAEQRIKEAGGKIPVLIRLEALFKLIESALKRGDNVNARSLVDQTQQLMDSYQWPLEKKIPLAARIFSFRYRAGDAETARNGVDALLAQYKTDGEKILFTRRVETLVPLAEAYQTMDKPAAALTVYTKALQEAETNFKVNLTAEYLSAICCSMAVKAVEPDAELWDQMHQIHKKLSIRD